ncbi:hypothetical protein QLX08_008009 [Tetragonisca angustula]|uniref:Uncharacterized protein n=1 Tax=Tetragonisca angustula TaxID=166442 RepID=A0AAW0ZMA8_9HYME
MVVVPRKEKKEGRDRGHLPPTAAGLTRFSRSSSSQRLAQQPLDVNKFTALLLWSLAAGTSIVHLRTCCSVVLQESTAYILNQSAGWLIKRNLEEIRKRCNWKKH